MQIAECPVYLDNGGLQYTNSTIGDITVNYPATVNQGDDLILVVFSAENSNTINAISGWNTIEINTGDAADGYAVFYKSAEGNLPVYKNISSTISSGNPTRGAVFLYSCSLMICLPYLSIPDFCRRVPLWNLFFIAIYTKFISIK